LFPNESGLFPMYLKAVTVMQDSKNGTTTILDLLNSNGLSITGALANEPPGAFHGQPNPPDTQPAQGSP
jgi:hypothetical protein